MLIYFSDALMFDHLVGENSEVSNGPVEVLEINHQKLGRTRTSEYDYSHIVD